MYGGNQLEMAAQTGRDDLAGLVWQAFEIVAKCGGPHQASQSYSTELGSV